MKVKSVGLGKVAYQITIPNIKGTQVMTSKRNANLNVNVNLNVNLNICIHFDPVAPPQGMTQEQL